MEAKRPLRKPFQNPGQEVMRAWIRELAKWVVGDELGPIFRKKVQNLRLGVNSQAGYRFHNGSSSGVVIWLSDALLIRYKLQNMRK